jgi:hypothetical protein
MPVLPMLRLLRTDVMCYWEPIQEGVLSRLPELFPALENFTYDMEEGVRLMAICLPLIGPNIRHIELDHCRIGYDEPGDWNPFAAIGPNCPNLISLILFKVDFEGTPADHPGLLHPLIGCSQLRQLDIEASDHWSDISLALVDDSLNEATKAWPKLEKLRFYAQPPSPGKYPEPSLSLGSIPVLVRNCPQLCDLTLTLNAKQRPLDDVPVLPTSLKTINFANSTVNNPHDIAAWLVNLCPAAGVRSNQIIKGKKSRGVKMEHRWDKVASIMAPLQASQSAVP